MCCKYISGLCSILAVRGFLILLTSLLVVFAAEKLDRRADGSYAEYSFSREDCLRTDIPDISTYKVAGNLQPVDGLSSGCIASNGYQARKESSRLQSSRTDDPSAAQSPPMSKTLPSLKVALGESPFAIEIWLRASETHSMRAVLFAIDPPQGRICSSQFQVYTT
jgi:hypothetical protein